MDESFGALDAVTRTTIQKGLLRIWSETKKSIIFVTQDIEGAVYLGDRVLLIGGQPAQVYTNAMFPFHDNCQENTVTLLESITT